MVWLVGAGGNEAHQRSRSLRSAPLFSALFPAMTSHHLSSDKENDFDLPKNFDPSVDVDFSEQKSVEWRHSSRWDSYCVGDMYSLPTVLRSDDRTAETCSFFVADCSEYRGKLIIKMVDWHYHGESMEDVDKVVTYAVIGDFAREDCGSFSTRREDREGLKDYVSFVLESYRRNATFRQLPMFELIYDVDENFNPVV